MSQAGPPPRLVLPADAPMLDWWRGSRDLLVEAGALELLVPDPDRGPAVDAGVGVGELCTDRHGRFLHRPWRVWVDLAEVLGCRAGTPRPAADGRVCVRLERLPTRDGGAAPGYGPESAFARSHKMEDAATLTALSEALARAAGGGARRVLVLGAHRGDELEALAAVVGPIETLDVVAVERDPAWVDLGRGRWPSVRWLEGDATRLAEWKPGRFDLAVGIGLLQSRGVEGNALLRSVVKQHLRPRSGIVVGLPNSRLVAGDWLWGARTRNVGPVEMGLVVRDAMAAKRYLQQQGFRVFLSGKYDLLITGTR